MVPFLFTNSFLPSALAEIAPTSLSTAVEQTAKDIPVYFGVGCFWHIQHEFVEAEKRILGRTDDSLTSLAGYAGGTRVGKSPNLPGVDGVVCYHNMLGVADYGSLGHGEVVGLNIPSASYKAFAEEYISLFDEGGDRHDKGDRGPEYRSLVGIPGGVKSELFPLLQEAASVKGIEVLEGKGDDADTLRKKIVWVMDSSTFPFKQAEVYHQFHDGFMLGEQYPESYNNIVKKGLASGLVKGTGCPNF